MGGEGGEDGSVPLLSKASGNHSELDLNRTGTVWSAGAHIITAVIGSGVVSLAWSTAQLGWVAGPIAMVGFAAITMLQSSLLADCYRSPDPDHGKLRNRSYLAAVKQTLGGRNVYICGFFQLVNLYGDGVAYTITSAASLRAVQKSYCHQRGDYIAPCALRDNFFMLLFGGLQLFFSQIPDFHSMEWLSVFAALMSFSYASIGLLLGLAKVIGDGTIKGGIGGVPMASTMQKVWAVCQALGDMAFAFSFAVVLLDIQDTLKAPPPENQTMKKASKGSIIITAFFYLCCGCFGYAAFGNDTPGNFLTGFEFYGPYWIVAFANTCIVLHLVGAYQVYSQPIFAFMDSRCADRFPNSVFVNKFYRIKLPFLPPYRLNLLRLCFRTVYVVSTTGVAMLFPYFNKVLGVLGPLKFWPLAIYFPVEMYCVQRQIRVWTTKWILLQSFSLFGLLICAVALTGSLEGIITEKLVACNGCCF